jgi:hypothetical protein
LILTQKEEDEAARVQQGKKLLADIMQANAAQAEAKLARRQAEIEEDRKIAVYLAYVEFLELSLSLSLSLVVSNQMLM